MPSFYQRKKAELAKAKKPAVKMAVKVKGSPVAVKSAMQKFTNTPDEKEPEMKEPAVKFGK